MASSSFSVSQQEREVGRDVEHEIVFRRHSLSTTLDVNDCGSSRRSSDSNDDNDNDNNNHCGSIRTNENSIKKSRKISSISQLCKENITITTITQISKNFEQRREGSNRNNVSFTKVTRDIEITSLKYEGGIIKESLNVPQTR